MPVELVVDRYYLAAVMKALLHSILFHRRFTSERPMEIDLDALNVTYARLEDPELERAVDEKVRMFDKALEPLSGRNKGQIAVMFFERRAKKSWFTKTEEEVCWEQWVITITIRESRTEREHIDARRALQKDLVTALTSISQMTNEQKDHIPPIVNNDPFPFQIVISSNSDASWTSMFKQMISSGGPWLSAT
ncbi:hypothetical protein SpCBS45565_g02265 [Spizellomyces sp. 'palustris']|nr:hypothetical protein SpCBS45565_g02265 [Spizellomyces sp. 'palustris']